VLMIKAKTDTCNSLEHGEEIHLKYNILISWKLRYLANLWAQRWQISRIFLCIDSTMTTHHFTTVSVWIMCKNLISNQDHFYHLIFPRSYNVL
jgi:hypothetical protein